MTFVTGGEQTRSLPKQELIVLAARVIELADEAQSFVLSHDRPASSFQQVLKGDRSIDLLRRAVHHRKAGYPFRGHQLGSAAAGAIGVDEELRRHSLFNGVNVWGNWRHQVPDDDDFKRIDPVLPRQVVPATAELFGQDRARHDKRRHRDRLPGSLPSPAAARAASG